MIEVKGLSKFYGRREILKDLSVRFQPGKITGIIGPNACGKSTFMKCLLGLVVPTSGLITIGGKNADEHGDFRRQIGFMPQNPVFPSHLSLNELLNMLEHLRGEKASARSELLRYFDLEKSQHRPFHQLSGGTQQKVAAVIAFMFASPLLILDEPSVSLDPISALSFKKLVSERARQGATVLLVSHIMSEIEEISDDVIFMNEGEIVFAGAPKDLLFQTNTDKMEQAMTFLLAEKERGASC
jgi:Cu-processing system ATP-binding protein